MKLYIYCRAEFHFEPPLSVVTVVLTSACRALHKFLTHRTSMVSYVLRIIILYSDFICLNKCTFFLTFFAFVLYHVMVEHFLLYVCR